MRLSFSALPSVPVLSHRPGWSRNKNGHPSPCPNLDPRITPAQDRVEFSSAARTRFSGKNLPSLETSERETAPLPPLSLYSLEMLSPEERGKVRQYCLDQIKETYNIAYNPQWHADLDTMASGHPEESLYNNQKGGHLQVARDQDGQIYGTAGLQRLNDRRPDLFQRFFPEAAPEDIGSIWRVYIPKKSQGQGLGTKLARWMEDKAKNLAYKMLYLHSDSHRAAAFWGKQGYKVIAEDNADGAVTVHLKKDLEDRRTSAAA